MSPPFGRFRRAATAGLTAQVRGATVQMYFRMIRNDFLRSKTTTLITMLFVAAAATLLSLAAILVVSLPAAIDSLMAQAKTPHFTQMHAGEVDVDRLAVFAAGRPEVEDYQVVEFLNIDGARIAFEGRSLAGSVQDNGFSVQNDSFDLLLDLNGDVIEVASGEVYVPIAYLQEGLVGVGDRLDVAGKRLTVAGFVRDSQMNSLLSSSKRFLVSPGDYAAIRSHGSVEYLIEFRLDDLSALGTFEAAYAAAGLEASGPTLTFPLFRTLNAISDGLMIAVILLVTMLIVVIAFLCIRFTLLAKIEEDYSEIGVLKAIGIRLSDIKRIYLAKYIAVAATGALMGLALSFALRGMVLENIRLYMGEPEGSTMALAVGTAGVAIVFLAIVAYVNRVLSRFRSISVTEAIRFGTSQDQPPSARRFRLDGNRLLDTNVFLGVKDVLARKKLYITMLMVLVAAAFIVIVPQNLHNTIASPSFISYMGVGDSDMRVDVQQTDGIAAKTAAVATVLEKDPAVSKYSVLLTRAFTVRTDDGADERIKVELGDHSVFPLVYSKGRAPAADDEIALSVMNADELGKSVGNTLIVLVRGQERRLTVSGVYSDVTQGGKTAKAAFDDPSAEVMWGVINVELASGSVLEEKAAEYEEEFAFAKVSSIDDFVAQTYGGTIRSVGLASRVSTAVALIISALITLLFMKMLVAKDRHSIATMKALGLRNADIRLQYAARSALVVVAGVALGALLANTAGEALAGQVIAQFGGSSFGFVVDPLSAYLLSPLLIAIAVLAATYFGTLDVSTTTIADNIKE